MNKKLILLLLAALTTLFLACSKDDENPNDPDIALRPEYTDPNIERAIKLTMKVDNDYKTVRFKLDFDLDKDYTPFKGYISESIAFPKDLSINWGDGTTTLSDTHEYKNSGTYTVTITGKDIKYFEGPIYTAVLEIDLKECKSLVYFDSPCLPNEVSGLSDCKALKYLELEFDNESSFNLKDFPALECFYSYSTGELTSLEINKCSALKYLDLWNSSITSLDASGLSNLQFLKCSSNSLTSLNANGCSALPKLSCHSEKLTSLDVRGCTALTKLDCSGNMKSVDVSECTNLKDLNCNYSRSLTTLKLNTAIEKLSCSSCNLTSLDISKCTNLKDLSCSNNRSLTTLKLNTAIEELYCSSCNLTSLDINNCSNLKWLDCSSNNLSENALNEIFNALPIPIDYSYDSYYVEIDENPGYDYCDKSIVYEKGWRVRNYWY